MPLTSCTTCNDRHAACADERFGPDQVDTFDEHKRFGPFSTLRRV